MKIIELLNQKGEISFGTRMLERIPVNGYYLSIQASENHYCYPRKTFKDLNLYTQFELAIFDSNEEWVIIDKNKIFKKFSRYSELLEKADAEMGNTQVFGWVNVDLIEDLYKYLKNLKND